MTTQQPTQPEATQDPVIMRVGRLEGIAEEIHHRLVENHGEHQTLRAETLALSEKVDRQGESVRAEMRALGEKVDTQGEAHRAEMRALDEKVDRLRADMYRLMYQQTFLLIGVIGGLVALFTAIG